MLVASIDPFCAELWGFPERLILIRISGSAIIENLRVVSLKRSDCDAAVNQSDSMIVAASLAIALLMLLRLSTRALWEDLSSGSGIHPRRYADQSLDYPLLPRGGLSRAKGLRGFRPSDRCPCRVPPWYCC